MNIVLIGYRGSGKTTIGRKLAQKLWMDFVDTDEKIVRRAGRTIQEIFAQQGEAAFRDLESAVLAELATHDNQVIATGGGIVLRAENVAALKRAGKVIWLTADPATLLARIHADTTTAATRPPLTLGGVAGGTLEEIQQLLAVRAPLYQAAAAITLDVTRMTPDEAVAWLASRI